MFSGIIFKVSIESYRTAAANTEIMQKLRVITDQLNADFRGLQKDAPLMVWFQQDPTDPNQRYDQVMFFAVGDFQSTQLYLAGPLGAVPDPAGTILVRGNAARIYYSQAMVFSPTTGPIGSFVYPWLQRFENVPDKMLNVRARTLARRQHILTADTSLFPFPVIADVNNFSRANNDGFEHDSISLARWKAIAGEPNSFGNNKIVDTCFGNRPKIDVQNPVPQGLHILMCQGVGSIAVQWEYQYFPGRYRWWPSSDPDGNPGTRDSDFDPNAMGAITVNQQFGMYFNMPDGIRYDLILNRQWFRPEHARTQAQPGSRIFPPSFYPRALKFTFTLYDSKNIIKGGRPFTHIVYLEN
jgi:hypothetical protein